MTCHGSGGCAPTGSAKPVADGVRRRGLDQEVPTCHGSGGCAPTAKEDCLS